MALPIPVFDERHYQDIVEELVQRIPLYCKEWTDHNASDPGITMIELFAWLADILIYRLNHMPEAHMIKLLEMLGMRLREPEPAKTLVTFWLSAQQVEVVKIPAGTEVASLQSETEPSIVFTTDKDLSIFPPKLKTILSHARLTGEGKNQFNELNRYSLENGSKEQEVFSHNPQAGDALYLGFENNISQHILNLQMQFHHAGAADVNPNRPPYVWEALTGPDEADWARCELEFDTTQAMSEAGQVQLILPQLLRTQIAGDHLYWVRAKVTYAPATRPGDVKSRFLTSPRLIRLSAACTGGSVPATHAHVTHHELLGKSDGTPGQRFQLQFFPVLPRQPGEELTVQTAGHELQHWTEVQDFATTGRDQNCYSINGVTGELRFGPAIRQRDGSIRLYGAIPPMGANLIFTSYRSGGGVSGNISAGVLTTLKTAIPYVLKICNRQPAWGGMDVETLEDCLVRAPALLRSHDRAITEQDFEMLAYQALPGAIGRVKCMQILPDEKGFGQSGRVYLLVIPKVPSANQMIPRNQLVLRSDQVAALTSYLDERRILTTRLVIRAPDYQWVAVKVYLHARPGADQAAIQKMVLDRLYQFLNPLVGGPDHCGWPFSRGVYGSDIYQCLQGVPQIEFIRLVELYPVKPEGEPDGHPEECVEPVVSHSIVVSGRHHVAFI